MDKIQAFLVTSGRKDLAQEYYKKASKLNWNEIKDLSEDDAKVKLFIKETDEEFEKLCKSPSVLLIGPINGKYKNILKDETWEENFKRMTGYNEDSKKTRAKAIREYLKMISRYKQVMIE